MSAGNRGNRRTGIVKGSHSGRRRGQLAWRKDPVILERVNLARVLRAKGYTAAQMLPLLNEIMRRHGQPDIGIDSVHDDIGPRLRELLEEEREKSAEAAQKVTDRHLEELMQVIREAWIAFHTAKGTSLNRGTFLNTISATVERMAKLDGSLAAAARLQDAGDVEAGESRAMFVLTSIMEMLPPEQRRIVARRIEEIEITATS